MAWHLVRSDPTVEFVIPFYGDPAYLKETVHGLLSQSDRDWTATVIDDCYPDPSVGDWVRKIGDTHLEVTRNERNLGANLSYKRGVELRACRLPGHPRRG